MFQRLQRAWRRPGPALTPALRTCGANHTPRAKLSPVSGERRRGGDSGTPKRVAAVCADGRGKGGLHPRYRRQIGRCESDHFARAQIPSILHAFGVLCNRAKLIRHPVTIILRGLKGEHARIRPARGSADAARGRTETAVRIRSSSAVLAGWSATVNGNISARSVAVVARARCQSWVAVTLVVPHTHSASAAHDRPVRLRTVCIIWCDE